jgi:hypothetical protein
VVGGQTEARIYRNMADRRSESAPIRIRARSWIPEPVRETRADSLAGPLAADGETTEYSSRFEVLGW